MTGLVEFPESDSNDSRIGGLSVSLADPDGRVIGGSAAGNLIAATPVQVGFRTRTCRWSEERGEGQVFLGNLDGFLFPLKDV